MTLCNVRPFISLASIGVCLAALGCAHAALVETDPPGAELFVNGTQVGITPYAIQDTVGGGDRYEIVLKKPGYAIKQETLIQDQFSWPRGVASVACGACTLGLGCLGLLWSWELQDRYSYVLEPLPASSEQSSSAPSDEASSGPSSAPGDEGGSGEEAAEEDGAAQQTVPI